MPPPVATPDSPLRVCMLAACPFPANHGTPGSIREMAEALAHIGHEVHIVTYHHGEDIALDGPRLHRISPLTRESTVVVGPTVRRPLYDLQMVFKTLQVVRRHRPHVIHAHGYEAALVAGVCRPVTRRPVVYSAHHAMADELPGYGFIRPMWLARGVAHALDAVVPRLADRCLPHSVNADRFLRRQGLQDRTDEIVNFGIDVDWVNGADLHRVRAHYGLGSAPVVLYTGVFDHFQRLDLLLQAFSVVAQTVPAAKLLMVSTVPQPEHAARLRGQIEQLRLSNSVVITEPQSLASVRDFLHAADVAVVPRPAAHGFPIKLLNYFAARRPSVLFASSASTGLVHRDNVMLATPDTADALAASIVEVLTHAPLREHLGNRGRAFVEQHHDRERIAHQVSQCYRRALFNDRSRREECPAFSS